MKRMYQFPDTTYETTGSAKALLCNHSGDFFCLDKDSSYQGWHHFYEKTWTLKKSIASITPLEEGTITQFTQQFYGVRRTYESTAQEHIILYQDVLLYHTESLRGKVRLTLDHRDIYEGSQLGRHYTILQEDGVVMIRFFNEHSAQQHYLCLKGVKHVDVLDSWREEHYEANAKRNAQATYWVYDAITFIPEPHVTIGQGTTAAIARTRTDIASHHFHDILSSLQQETTLLLADDSHLPDRDVRPALRCAKWSLTQLTNQFAQEHNLLTGIYAGLPWFFQLWSRDELISLGGLLSLAKKDPSILQTVHEILHRYLEQLQLMHEVPNRFPPSMVASVDALGWLALRAQEYFHHLQQQKKLFSVLTMRELTTWYQAFLHALHHQQQVRGVFLHGSYLIHNKEQETWMDTQYHDDARRGFRIEIQALHFALYDVLCYLARLLDAPEYQGLVSQRTAFRNAVQEVFIERDSLIDGLLGEQTKDLVVRPNVFVAAYVAPHLFSTTVWKRTLHHHLDVLYLPWGGLATIDPQHPLYQASYTGEDNRSYHRGDSWYFINNLAAIVLSRLHREDYTNFITALLHASARDILRYGYAGHGSELSSASVPGGEASPVQAWSIATFIEAVNLYYPRSED